MQSSSNKPLSLSKIIRRYVRPSFQDSVDDEKRLRIDYQVNPGWKRGQFCWEAKGPIAKAYALLEPRIKAELNQAHKESDGEVFVLLYMVGKDTALAKPIIVVSSIDTQSRKNAKSAIERSGILTGTDFTIGDMRFQPSGRIKPVATQHDSSLNLPSQTSSYEVLYDPKERIRLVGMPIFIRHRGSAVRRATANAVYNGSHFGYVTAAHALDSIETNNLPMDEDEDMDMPFDSSSDDEGSDDGTRDVLSQRSDTSPEYLQSEQSVVSSAESSVSCESFHETMPTESLFSSDFPPGRTERAITPKVANPGDATATRLETLGGISSISSAVDCIVISITAPGIAATLARFRDTLAFQNEILVDKAKRTKVVAWSAHGCLDGILAETPVLMRLRNSTSYIPAYKFTYHEDGAITMGDCGTLVTDVDGKFLYGHVIANSEHSRMAFMVAAKGVIHILQAIGGWRLLSLTDTPTADQTVTKPSIQLSSWASGEMDAVTPSPKRTKAAVHEESSSIPLGSESLHITSLEASLTAGSVSFLFQIFAGCILGYELIADACKYHKHYEDDLIRIKIEEHRLLDWANTIGLDYTDLDLRLDHTTRGKVMGVLEQQQKLLHSFGRLDETYLPLLNPALVEIEESFDFDSDLHVYNDSSSVQFPRAPLVSKVQRFSRLLKMPTKRLEWATFGNDKIQILVGHLVHSNDELQDSLDRAQQDNLRQEQLRTSYQIVALNRTVAKLARIVQSQKTATSLPYPALLNQSDSEYRLLTRPSARDPYINPLAALVRFATIHRQSGESDYSGDQLDRESNSNRIELEQIQTAQPWDCLDEAERSEGTYHHTSIWIEWKFPDPGPGYLGGPSNLKHKRITTLAALLKEMNTIAEFRAPKCLGYFEDEENGRYGFVFAKPEHVASNESPTTLRSFLAEEAPPLGDRISLMRLLSETVELFHAVDWLHMGLRSANILFFKDPETDVLDMTNPYISGFEYARPATRDDMTERPSDDPAAEIYRHPATQSINHSSNFLRSWDIYSLGVILLEIAYWKPIEEIVGIGNIASARPKHIYYIRKKLLEDVMYSKYVRSHVGVAVQSVIWACLMGPEAFGLDARSDERDALTGANLLSEFGERVVKKLMSIKGL